MNKVKHACKNRIPVLALDLPICMSKLLKLGAVHKVRHAIFGQFLPPHSPCHTSSHIPGPPESTSHISDPPPIFRRPNTETWTKAPLYKFCLNCSQRFLSRGFCQGAGVFCLEGFVRGGFC